MVALVNGKELSSGFGGAEATPLIVRPTTEFNHNILQPDPAHSLVLSAGPSSFLSYNSGGGILPWDALPAAPPSDNQRASVRSLSDIQVNATRVYGEAILPTVCSLSEGSGEIGGEVRLDDGYLPMKFAPPDLGGGLSNPPTSGAIAPGNYSVLATPGGANLSLARGGVYYFADTFLGTDNIVTLSGPAGDGPCVIYTHTFSVGDNSRVNMPAPGIAPIPGELQIYGTAQEGCDLPGVILNGGAEAAFVTAGNNMGFELVDNSKFYGAAIAGRVTIGSNVEFHYDEALLGQVQEARSEWVMVSQGRH